MNDPNYHPMISRLREILMVDLPSDAVVAGGCLRDCILGGIPKDVDVFVGPGLDVRAWVEAHGGNCRAVGGAATEYDAGLQASVAQVFDTNLRVGADGLAADLDGPEIQFIQMKRPTSVEEQFARFDFDFWPTECARGLHARLGCSHGGIGCINRIGPIKEPRLRIGIAER